ncbi:MAG: hypothetical protein AB1665_01490 [Candidatus Thermoplasmatota archaeon]
MPVRAGSARICIALTRRSCAGGTAISEEYAPRIDSGIIVYAGVDYGVINKVSTAVPQHLEMVRKNVAKANSKVVIMLADSPISAEGPEMIRGKKVLVVEISEYPKLSQNSVLALFIKF